MKEESRSILLELVNTVFKEFKENARKIKWDEDFDIPYDITKFHRIKEKEFEQEGYYMVTCTQEIYNEIDESHIEIWKVYKTEKYYHVVEFDQIMTLARRPTYNFSIYSYYDYERQYRPEEELWRNSTEILGIKLPDKFEL